jgi:hypothetical protein
VSVTEATSSSESGWPEAQCTHTYAAPSPRSAKLACADVPARVVCCSTTPVKNPGVACAAAAGQPASASMTRHMAVRRVTAESPGRAADRVPDGSKEV